VKETREQIEARERARRNREIAKIQLARKQLEQCGFDELAYRAMLKRVAGCASSSELTADGRALVLDELKRLGFKPSPARGAGRSIPEISGPQGSQVKMIRALWLDLKELGVLRDPSERATRQLCETVDGTRGDSMAKCGDRGDSDRLADSVEKESYRRESSEVGLMAQHEEIDELRKEFQAVLDREGIIILAAALRMDCKSDDLDDFLRGGPETPGIATRVKRFIDERNARWNRIVNDKTGCAREDAWREATDEIGAFLFGNRRNDTADLRAFSQS
jgi:phage gp16-like protein